MKERIYGVIAEWKAEQPILIETPLLTYEAAYERMRGLAACLDVIRVAIFKAVYVTGNEAILPKQESN